MAIYKCPYKCSRGSSYPEKKWKTEKGFQKHLAKCPMRPEAVAQREAERKKQEEEAQLKRQNLLDSFPHKIGDKIYISTYVVTKPIYQQRGSRMVKMRYEEERRYYAEQITIQSIEANAGCFQHIVINGKSNYTIFNSLADAEKDAEESRKAYQEHCEFASRCR